MTKIRVDLNNKQINNNIEIYIYVWMTPSFIPLKHE